MANQDEPVHINSDRVRGAEKSGAVRYILGISLVLIIVVFAAILLS